MYTRRLCATRKAVALSLLLLLLVLLLSTVTLTSAEPSSAVRRNLRRTGGPEQAPSTRSDAHAPQPQQPRPQEGEREEEEEARQKYTQDVAAGRRGGAPAAPGTQQHPSDPNGNPTEGSPNTGNNDHHNDDNNEKRNEDRPSGEDTSIAPRHDKNADKDEMNHPNDNNNNNNDDHHNENKEEEEEKDHHDDHNDKDDDDHKETETEREGHKDDDDDDDMPRPPHGNGPPRGGPGSHYPHSNDHNKNHPRGTYSYGSFCILAPMLFTLTLLVFALLVVCCCRRHRVCCFRRGDGAAEESDEDYLHHHHSDDATVYDARPCEGLYSHGDRKLRSGATSSAACVVVPGAVADAFTSAPYCCHHPIAQLPYATLLQQQGEAGSHAGAARRPKQEHHGIVLTAADVVVHAGDEGPYPHLPQQPQLLHTVMQATDIPAAAYFHYMANPKNTMVAIAAEAAEEEEENEESASLTKRSANTRVQYQQQQRHHALHLRQKSHHEDSDSQNGEVEEEEMV